MRRSRCTPIRRFPLMLDHCAVPSMELKPIITYYCHLSLWVIRTRHSETVPVRVIDSHRFEHDKTRIGKGVILCVHLCGYSNLINKLIQVTTISDNNKKHLEEEMNEESIVMLIRPVILRWLPRRDQTDSMGNHDIPWSGEARSAY
jgi:hypothetical protein